MRIGVKSIAARLAIAGISRAAAKAQKIIRSRLSTTDGVQGSRFIARIKKNPTAKVREKPAAARTLSQQIEQARKLGYKFSGHDPKRVKRIPAPPAPNVVLEVGAVVGIIYSAKRDGVVKHYIHKFKKQARPLLCVSPDGHQLILAGGRYSFTETGINDSR